MNLRLTALLALFLLGVSTLDGKDPSGRSLGRLDGMIDEINRSTKAIEVINDWRSTAIQIDDVLLFFHPGRFKDAPLAQQIIEAVEQRLKTLNGGGGSDSRAVGRILAGFLNRTAFPENWLQDEQIRRFSNGAGDDLIASYIDSLIVQTDCDLAIYNLKYRNSR